MKYLKYIIIFVIVIIVLLVVLIFSMSKNENNVISSNNVVTSNVLTNRVSNTNNTINNVSSNNVVDREIDGAIVDGSINHLRDYSMFFTVEDAVQKHIMLTNPSAKFRAVDMNYVSGYLLNQYGVYGNILEANGNISDAYFIVNMNQGNLKYSVQEQKNVTSLSSLKLSIPVENSLNDVSTQAKFVNATDDVIVKRIMEDYIYLARNYPQTAYKMLDKTYSGLKFKDYTEYLNYIRNNLDTLQSIEIVSYNSNASKTEYIIKDNFANIYNIKLTGLMNYTIILDDYTIMNETSYLLLSEEDRVKFNINKIIKMINTCDYSNLYSKLNSTFKNNNFNTQNTFENYLKSNYFSYNIIDSINISRDTTGGVYICSVNLKKESRVAADTVTKTIVMKLDSGTNFEFSFGM